jgi:hypothetical protein
MADHNSVGAEYIIMEKSPGIELERVWPNMDITERFEVVRAIAGFQKSWTSVCFNKFGSLYYANDLHDSATTHLVYIDKDGKEVLDDRYAVGPSTGREFIDNGRATVSFDRGPCKPHSYPLDPSTNTYKGPALKNITKQLGTAR